MGLLFAVLPSCAEAPRLSRGVPQSGSNAPWVLEAIRTADQVLAAGGVQVPEEAGDWIFYYSCPDHDRELERRGGENVCPVCGKTYDTAKVRGAWATRRHDLANEQCLALARAWRATSNPAYAECVWHALLLYAERMPDWGRHDRWGRKGLLAVGGGRRYAQSLDDSCGIIALARAFDMVRDSPAAQSEAERERIVEGLLRETAGSIYALYPLYEARDNHMAWFNAAAAVVGAVIGDDSLVARALDGSKGLRWQLENSVTKDGVWYEGATGYHYYALDAIVHAIEAARAAGFDVDDAAETAEKMFLAPARLCYPDNTIPAVNDSYKWTFPHNDPRLRDAAEVLDSPGLRDIAANGFDPSRLDLPSEALEGAGLVFLRTPADAPGGQAVAVLDFGEHGDWHGHPDKMNLLYFAAGREVFTDIGWISYRCPEYKTWARTTIAHNTVTLDGANQSPDNGSLPAFEDRMRDEGGFAFAIGESRGAYPGATLRRALVLFADGTLVDLFRVESEKPRTMDWALHTTGSLSVPEAGGECGKLGDDEDHGYPRMREERRHAAFSDVLWTALDGDAPVETRLLAPDGVPETLYTAIGVGHRLDERAPMLVRRREAAATTVFAAVHSPAPGRAATWSATSEDPERISLQGSAGDRTVSVEWDGASTLTVR
jgi:hypothetical protein